MRRVIIILFLVLSVSLQAQIVRTHPVYVVPSAAGAPAFCPEYQLVYNAMTTKPGSDTAWIQNDMVYSLDSAGYWDGFTDLLYVFATRAQQGANLNWVDVTSFTLTDPGSTAPPFIKYQGYDPQNADYLATGFIPSTSKINIGQNSVTLGAWCLDEFGTGASDRPIGAYDAVYYLTYYPWSAVPDLSGTINRATASSFGNHGSAIGFTMVTRRGATDLTGYYNGGVVGLDNDASAGEVGHEFFVLAHNNDGTAANFCDARIALIIVCKAVSDDDATKIYNILHRYMTRIGL